MEISEHVLINDDGMQAPLLPQEQNSEDDYQMELISQNRKEIFQILWSFSIVFLCLDGTPTRYVSEND